jgi:hypothetical protein
LYGSLERPDIPVIQPRQYTEDTYLDNRTKPTTTQLWEPVKSSVFSSFPFLNITPAQFNTALKHYFKRVHRKNYIPSTDEPFEPALKVWFDNYNIYGSELHRIKKRETRRSNHYVYFTE